MSNLAGLETTRKTEVVCIKKVPKKFPHEVGKKYECLYFGSEELYYVGGFFFDKKRHSKALQVEIRKCPAFENYFAPIKKIRKKKLIKIEQNINDYPNIKGN